MSSSVSFEDATTVTLAEADLTEKKCGEFIESPKRGVFGCSGLEWWLRWYPAGIAETVKNHVSVFLMVNKPVTAKFTCAFANSSKTFTHEFRDSSKAQGWPRFASHDKLRPIFRDGKLNITCSVEFNVKPPKPIVTVKDTTTFMLNETDLTGKKVGEFFITPKRAIPCSDGLQWWVQWYPSGEKEAHNGHVSVYLWVNKPVTANFTFAVADSSISSTHVHKFVTSPSNAGRHQYASHEQLRPQFRNGKTYITCHVEFIIIEAHYPSMPHLYTIYNRVPTDYTLEVGPKKVEVHREYLSSISPKFRTMLSSGKSKSRKMKIPNMEYDAVKAAIDFCYGRELHDKSVESFIGILKFANKYEMVDVAAEVERYLLSNLSVDSVTTLLLYADDTAKDDCFDKCVEYVKYNFAIVAKSEKFRKLPLAIVIRVLKKAFEFKTVIELLRYSDSHVSMFERLENVFLTLITLEEFVPTVSYAWDCNRENLKKSCAQFYAKNQVEVMKLNNFYTLPAETIGGIIKLANELNQILRNHLIQGAKKMMCTLSVVR